MTWADAAPPLGAALVVLLVPGGLVVAAAGVRGLLRVALAPVLSVAAAAGAAVGASTLGMPFGPVPLAAATLTAAAVVLGGRLLGRHLAASPRVPPPAMGHGAAEHGAVEHGAVEHGAVVAGLAGAAVGAVALAVGVAGGMGAPDRWPQTFDAVFHLAAVDHVLRTGDGSALTLGVLVAPERSHGFYPAAWHDLVALVVSMTGTPVPVAANAVALVTVAVAWPLGCVGLARVAAGPRPVVVAGAGVLAAGVAASPVLLTAYGTLWPNALATALLPAVLALVADLGGLGPQRSAPVVGGTLLLAGAVAGLALAHPNAVVSLLVLTTPALVVGTWWRGPRWRLMTLAASASIVWLVLLSAVFDAQRDTSWPARQRLPQAVGEWLALAPQRVPVPLVVAALALLGCVVAWRRAGLRWLLAVHVTAGALFVLVAGSDGRLSRLVSGAWWDDPFRLAALAGVAGVPLAAVGLEALARRVATVVRWPGRSAHVGAAATALLVVTVVATGGLSTADTTRVVHWWYAPDAMLGPSERGLVESLPRLVPEGERVVGSPWDGAALTGALGGREPVFPHLVGDWGADRTLLATSLSAVARTPAVCAALGRLRVTHVLVGPGSFWADDPRRARYRGLAVAGHDGFTEVARGGSASLWRVSACD
ncbi:hypothetical protein GCM10023168_35870 [Fodinibacter luteus]|uniref:Uncharacterized protein n=1 Tax=Fodinibacter luteus TaxID=552064 RepID=A0ABP8KR51_9MICO